MTPTGRLESILVATDLTENSQEALKCAGDLAMASGAKLYVIHAEEAPGLADDRDVLTLQRQVHTTRMSLMDALAEILPPTIAVEAARVRSGPAAEIILHAAVEIQADVIILGAHRDRGFADRFRGSTAELVLRHARVPCLIANAPLQIPVERIIVPTDFSSPARRATATALAWGRILSGSRPAELTLTHVVTGDVEVNQPWAATELEVDLRAAAREAVGSATSHGPIEICVLRGVDPVDTLISRAEASGAGLMVLGTQGDGVLLRALLGSLSSAMVRRAPFPLLLVPPGASPVAEVSGEHLAAAAPNWQEITL
jgi:nucleotide-binding universal stress UspA family protein